MRRPSFKREDTSILIVEDNETNQMVIQGMLNLFSVNSDIAENGKKAISLLSKKSYDLILMDCRMPVMDGYEATKIIRDENSTVLDHKVPILAVTASTVKGDRERCLNIGMNDYLVKPINITMMQTKLEYWLSAPKSKPLKNTNKKIPLKKHNSNKIFDYSALNERLGGNQDLIKSICAKFIKSIAVHIDNLKTAVLENNMEEATSKSHKLKGSAATIGCIRLSTLAHEIETGSKNHDLRKIHNALSQLRPCYIISKNAIEERLKLIN